MRKEAERAGALGTAGAQQHQHDQGANAQQPPTRARGTFANPFLLNEAPVFQSKEEREGLSKSQQRKKKKAEQQAREAAPVKYARRSANGGAALALGHCILTAQLCVHRDHKTRIQHQYFSEDS